MLRARLALVALATILACAGLSADATAQPYDYLLAPPSACGGRDQTNMALSQRAQTQAMLCLHNWARNRASGERPLTPSGMLTSAALAKARDIMRCRPQALRHTPCGEQWDSRIQQAGYERSGCYGVAENIAFGTDSLGSVRSIMDLWLNSQHHRANILTGSYRGAGFAFVRGTFEGYRNVTVWVADFGYRC